MRIGSLLKVMLCCGVLAAISGCLRYVPSQKELAEAPSSVSGQADAYAKGMLAGPEAFQAHEEGQRERLKQLLESRKTALRGKPLGSYEVGPGDLLKVEVFGLSDLRTEFVVEPDGSAELPLIGRLQFGGKELWELRKDIRERLKKYVRNPQVSLSVVEYRSHMISVIGEVRKPGIYPLERIGQSLIEMLSLAGGRTERAGHRVIVIPKRAVARALREPSASNDLMSLIDYQLPMADNRGEAAQSKLSESDIVIEDDAEAGVSVSVVRLMGADGRRPVIIPLAAGDTIVIPPAGKFAVDGEVEKPGSYALTERTSVLGAVAAAGGLTYSADVKNVELVRDIGDGRKALLVVDLETLAKNTRNDVTLQDGDVVRVPSDASRFGRRQVVEFINGLFKVGLSGSVR